MELSAVTLEHLQLEAYAFLCREAVQEKLVEIEREKETVASTRPPFGVLARKQARDAFTQAMRTTLDNEAALRDRLTQITAIEEWLQSKLRAAIAAYLAEVSADHECFAQIRARLVDWERAFLALPELLVALARDVRETRSTATAAGPGGRAHYQHQLGVLRDTAVRVESQHNELLVIAGAITERTPPGELSKIRLPVLPDFRRVAWVARLAVLPPDQTVAELTRVEAEIRAFLADGNHTILARLEAGRDVCAQLETQAVDLYWNQLRVHARTHYVEVRDFDDVFAMLAQRLARAEIERQKEELSSVPFHSER